MKKKLFAALLAVSLTASLFAGCGASSKSASAAAAPAEMDMSDYYNSAAEAEMSEMAMGSATSGAMPDFSAVRQNAKLILNAYISAEAVDFDTARQSIEALAATQGGYIESSSIGGNTGYRYTDYTLRIPQKNYETFLNLVGDSCHVTDQSTSTEDVTEAYTDLETRLKTLTTKQDRLMALLEKADKMEDIISLENALADVTYQIESLTGSLRHYDNLVDFATIQISLREVRDLTALQEKTSFGSELLFAFRQGASNLVEFLREASIGLVYAWPFVLILILLVVLVIPAIRRKLKKRSSKKLNSKQQLPESDSKAEEEQK